MATEYDVVAEFRVKESAANSAVFRRTAQHFEGLQSKARMLGDGIGRALTGGGLAVLGGGYLFQRAARGLVGMNAQLDDAKIGIASLLSANLGLSMGRSMGMAREQLKLLRKDAAEGVGELEDYVQGFQSIAAPVTGAGGSLETVRSLVRGALTAGTIQQGPEGGRLAIMDIRQALTAGLGDRTTPIALQAVEALGVTAEQFNAKTIAEKVEILNEAFGLYDEGAKLMGQGWNAQVATLSDGVREMAMTLTRPLFERWSEQLRAANEWLAANRDTLEEMATVWGERLVGVWDQILERAGSVAAIMAGVGAAKALPLGSIASAGFSAGQAALPFGTMAMGGATAAGAGALGTVGALGGLFVVLAASALAVKSAIAENPALLEELATALGGMSAAAGELLASFDNLVGEGSILTVFGTGLVKLTVFFMDEVAAWLKVAALFVDGLGMIFKFVGSFAVGIAQAGKALMSGDLAGAKKAVNRGARGAGSAILDFVDQAVELAGKSRISSKVSVEEGAAGIGSGGEPTGGGNTFIGTANFEIKQEVNTDPARVVSVLEEAVKRANEFPRAAKRRRTVI